MQELTVPPNEAAKKLANFLKKQFPIGYVRRLFRKNGARLNGRRAKADDPIRGGDRIQLYLPFESQADNPPRPRGHARLAIVYEDPSMLVVNKPAGLAVHEGKTVSKAESLAGLVEKKYRTKGLPPRLAHRLDKDTSGLLILAKDDQTLEAMEGLLATGSADKEYLCLVVGRLPNNDGKIDFPLPGRDSHLVRALTRYRVIKRFSETTFVRVAIETGRLHQIRLHFAKLGHPVVMDDQHGDFEFNKRFRKTFGLKRQFLHAHKLAIEWGGRRQSWTAPLADDLERTLERLESERN